MSSSSAVGNFGALVVVVSPQGDAVSVDRRSSQANGEEDGGALHACLERRIVEWRKGCLDEKTKGLWRCFIMHQSTPCSFSTRNFPPHDRRTSLARSCAQLPRVSCSLMFRKPRFPWRWRSQYSLTLHVSSLVWGSNPGRIRLSNAVELSILTH